jgi:hypothetical protein
MTSSEQRLFARLAVFTAAAPLRALETICEADMETLTLLLDTGFVRRLECVDGVARFVLPELVRAYARERLHTSGEEADIARAHAVYYLNYARGLKAGATGSGEDAEQGNFWAAVEWAKANDPPLAQEVGEALIELFRARGQTAAERSVIATIDRGRLPGAAPASDGDTRTDQITRSRELLTNGDFESAVRRLEQTLSDAHHAGDEQAAASAAAYLGLAEIFRGHHGLALRALLTVLRLLEAGAADHLAGHCFEGMAAVAAHAGDKVHAARMQGAATALGGDAESIVRSLRRSTAGTLLQALGREAYESAVASGSRLTLGEAAAEARAGRVLAPSG